MITTWICYHLVPWQLAAMVSRRSMCSNTQCNASNAQTLQPPRTVQREVPIAMWSDKRARREGNQRPPYSRFALMGSGRKGKQTMQSDSKRWEWEGCASARERKGKRTQNYKLDSQWYFCMTFSTYTRWTSFVYINSLLVKYNAIFNKGRGDAM